VPSRLASVARFETLAAGLVGRDGVTQGASRRGFGSGALAVDGRIFALLKDGRLVLKLPAGRVAGLIERGHGRAFDAGKGRPIREWIVLEGRADRRWLALANEARAFVRRASA